jgi:hypothetical protein
MINKIKYLNIFAKKFYDIYLRALKFRKIPQQFRNLMQDPKRNSKKKILTHFKLSSNNKNILKIKLKAGILFKKYHIIFFADFRCHKSRVRKLRKMNDEKNTHSCSEMKNKQNL